MVGQPIMPSSMILMSLKVVSIALYGASLIFNENKAQKKHLENILMKVNKCIYGPGTIKLNYRKLCNSIKVNPPDQKILKINTQYIAKIFYEKEVKQILEMLNPTKGWVQKCISTRPEVSEADHQTPKKFRIILN